jgi:hypothetical protein
MSEQIDLFEPDPDLVEHLAEVAFDAWSGAWTAKPELLRWSDLRTEPPKDKFRAAVRAVLVEQAKGVA